MVALKSSRFSSLIKLLFVFMATLLISGCVKNNPDPSWIEVTEWTLHSNPELNGQEGELTENLSDARVFIDDQLIGVFEVPFIIPVLLEGKHTVKLFPTVLNNGISATKKTYPFTEMFEIDVELIKNQTATINPVTRYNKFVQFYIEDFEDASNDVENDPTSLSQFTVSGDPSIIQDFNGNGFMRVSLDDVLNNWIGYTNKMLSLPRGQEVYLEIDYHNTNRITTGLLGIGPSGVVDNPNIQLNPQDNSSVKWKKIYIDLKEIVSNSPSAEYFELSFFSQLDEGENSGQINIDNIKVIHF